MTDRKPDVLGPVLADVAKVRADVRDLADRLADVERAMTEHGARLLQVDGLGPLVSDLAQRVARLIDGPGEENQDDARRADHRRPWAKLAVTEGSSHREDLTAWITSVLDPQYGEYLARLWPDGVETPRDNIGRNRVPPCWPEHPAACNELWTLFVTWWAAYADDDAKPRDVADWHDRLLPGVLSRLPAIFKCRHQKYRNQPDLPPRMAAAYSRSGTGQTH